MGPRPLGGHRLSSSFLFALVMESICSLPGELEFVRELELLLPPGTRCPCYRPPGTELNRAPSPVPSPPVAISLSSEKGFSTDSDSCMILMDDGSHAEPTRENIVEGFR